MERERAQAERELLLKWLRWYANADHVEDADKLNMLGYQIWLETTVVLGITPKKEVPHGR